MRDITRTAQSDKRPLITVTQAKQWMRLTHASEDDVIKILIETSAVEKIEKDTRYQLFTATWVLWDDGANWDESDCGTFELPRPPAVSVSEVAWVDRKGGVHVIPTENYNLITGKIPGVVIFDELSDVLSLIGESEETFYSYKITYVAGFGADQGDLPEWTQVIARELVANYYAMRMGADAVKGNKPMAEIEAELEMYRQDIL